MAMTGIQGLSQNRWGSSHANHKTMKKAAISIFLLLLLANQVLSQSLGGSSSPNSAAPSAGMQGSSQKPLQQSREELMKLILEKQNLVRKKLNQIEDNTEAKEYEKLADDLIQKSVGDKTQQEKLEKLSIAQEIIKDPIASIRGLKKKLSLRDKAKAALDEARNEKDPKLQAKLLEKAEKLIVEYKTGKPPKPQTQQLTEDEADPITADQVEGRFGEDLEKFTRKVVSRFLKRAYATQDEARRNHTLSVAKEILHDPKKSIKRWVRRQDIRKYIKGVDLEMRKLIAKSNPAKQKLLLKRKEDMLKDPVGFYNQIRREEEAKIEALALAHGKRLVESANKEKDFAKARLIMREAQIYLDAPMLSWANRTRTSAQIAYLASVPPICKADVEHAFHLIKTPLERIIQKVNTPPPPPPISNIVNFAETSVTAMSMTGKKKLPHDEAFDTDKNYIKLSFKGWMKKNSELPEDEKVKALSPKTTKPKLLPAKRSKAKPNSKPHPQKSKPAKVEEVVEY